MAPPGSEKAADRKQAKGDGKGGEGKDMALKRRQEAAEYGRKLSEQLGRNLDLQSVSSVAAASNLGDFFQYVIDHPVTLPRQKSAMLPIVSKDVEGTRVSIYNERTLAKHPLLGLKFKNTTGMHLMQGPITVFDGSTYAGDARILDLQKGEERLLSYAIDLGTEVEPVARKDPDRFTAVKIVKGVLHTTTKVRETKTYNVKNRSDQDRLVLIEHPFRADFKVTGKDQPRERARDAYRFELKVPAGETGSIEVVEERDIARQVVLSNSDDPTIRLVLTSNFPSKAVQEAIKKAQELRWKVAETQREVQHARQQLADIERDQARIRQNLKETPPTAAAYKKYLKKLDDQEGEIDRLNDRIKELQAREVEQKKAYDTYLANLNVE
jgi:hypothetical protein